MTERPGQQTGNPRCGVPRRGRQAPWYRRRRRGGTWPLSWAAPARQRCSSQRDGARARPRSQQRTVWRALVAPAGAKPPPRARPRRPRTAQNPRARRVRGVSCPGAAAVVGVAAWAVPATPPARARVRERVARGGSASTRCGWDGPGLSGAIAVRPVGGGQGGPRAPGAPGGLPAAVRPRGDRDPGGERCLHRPPGGRRAGRRHTVAGGRVRAWAEPGRGGGQGTCRSFWSRCRWPPDSPRACTASTPSGWCTAI